MIILYYIAYVILLCLRAMNALTMFIAMGVANTLLLWCDVLEAIKEHYKPIKKAL